MKDFELHLKKAGLAENTVRSYLYGVRFFLENYELKMEDLFAKNFLAKYNDIALLADLMGHESIETTRIYLRKTATEQQNIVDKIVNW
ncbi:integrase/recombinase, phage integrase family [Streptococcus pneumoniae]|nr:integrase/recombinase, phage integrase family [Streptococcus pneumoniae]VPZ98114.1 integrase/recombinase, phage integrase family [Streptococcus pneumoniae]